MPHFYNKFHRRETLLCDIQICHPANSQIRQLEINMRYNNINYYHIRPLQIVQENTVVHLQ